MIILDQLKKLNRFTNRFDSNLLDHVKVHGEKAKFHSQSGQALVEAMLFMIIMAMIFLGVIYQFSTAFQSWGENYFGNYLECLLANAEVPRLSGPANESSVCEKKYEAFSLANGRPKKFIGASAGTSGGGASTGGAGHSDTTPADAAPNNSGGTSGGRAPRMAHSAVGQTEGSTGSGAAGGGQSIAIRKGSSNGDGGYSSRTKIGDGNSYTGSDKAGLPSWATKSGDDGRMEIQRSAGIKGRGGFYEDEKEEREKQRSFKVTGQVDKNGKDPNKKISMLVKQKAEAKTAEVKDEGWSFGDFFRYILIAAIIIGLVASLGGQFVQREQE